MASQDVSAQLDVIKRGAVQIYSEEELASKLERSARDGRPLRVKLGMDPTAPDVHIGHSVVLRKMRDFQDLGHTGVLVVGDYTARVGDPSGQKETRPQLTPAEIDANAATYLEQVERILHPERLEVVKNGSWFEKLTFEETLALTASMTVARMLERDDFSERYKAGTPIQIHEFIYCLMQGWDSVMIRSDVELGGTDQTFNLLVGRDLQRAEGQEPQVCLTMPLLEGIGGGPKMSKSLGNAVGVTEDPDNMYGKVMSIPDSLMESYYTLLTKLPEDRIAERLSSGTHPREAKAALAHEVTATYHGEEAARAAAAEFDRRFRKGEDPSEIATVMIPAEHLAVDGADADAATVSLARLIVAAGFASSNSEARRLVKQGAVKLDGEKAADPQGDVTVRRGTVLRVGKLRVGKVDWE